MAIYSQYTLDDILTQLEFKVDGVPFWSQNEAIDAINEALLTWNAFTGFWKRTVIIPTTNLNAFYPLPASLVFGMRVEFNNKPLNLSSIGDMDYGHPGWNSQNTASGGSVPTEPKNWLPLSCNMIAIWPADALGGNTLLVDGVAATPTMVSLGDFIDIGDEQLNIILGYALHVLALKEGGARFMATMPYFQAFLQAAAEENDQLTQSSEFRNFLGTDLNRQTRVTMGSPTAYDQFAKNGA
jgi:hypothetical protein